MGRERLELFSDGVIAIAITLLVLDLRVPQGAGEHLGQALLTQWPAYAAYLTSFVTIGIMWVNHNAIFNAVASADRPLLFLNLMLLLGIATLPFTTSLAATYLVADRGATLALIVYSGWMAFIAAMFTLILAYLGWHPRLLRPSTTRAQNRGARKRAIAGMAAYVAAGLLALFSPVASLLVCLALPLYFGVAGRRLAEPAGLS